MAQIYSHTHSHKSSMVTDCQQIEACSPVLSRLCRQDKLTVCEAEGKIYVK